MSCGATTCLKRTQVCGHLQSRRCVQMQGAKNTPSTRTHGCRWHRGRLSTAASACRSLPCISMPWLQATASNCGRACVLTERLHPPPSSDHHSWTPFTLHVRSTVNGIALQHESSRQCAIRTCFASCVGVCPPSTLEPQVTLGAVSHAHIQDDEHTRDTHRVKRGTQTNLQKSSVSAQPLHQQCLWC